MGRKGLRYAAIIIGATASTMLSLTTRVALAESNAETANTETANTETTNPATANADSTVVLIATPHITPIATRLQQEIEALGFVVRLEKGQLTERPEVALSARGAIAAVEISTTSPGYIALHVLEPQTGRIIRQELPIEAPNDPTATELVTTRAVELLRAARLEVTKASRQLPKLRAPETTIVTATPKPKKPTRSATHSELQLGAGLGTYYVPRWRVGTHVLASVTYLNARGLGWHGSLNVATSSAQMQITDVGTVAATPTSFRFGTTMRAVASNPIGLRLSGGVEWTLVKFTGSAAPPYAGNSTSQSTLGPWIAVGSSVRISTQLQLLTQLGASWAAPKTLVRFAGEELRAWGRPTCSGSLVLEWQSL